MSGGDRIALAAIVTALTSVAAGEAGGDGALWALPLLIAYACVTIMAADDDLGMKLMGWSAAVTGSRGARRRRAAQARAIEALLPSAAVPIEARGREVIHELDSLCRWAGAPARGGYCLARMELSDEQAAALAILLISDRRVAMIRPSADAADAAGGRLAELCRETRGLLERGARAP